MTQDQAYAYWFEWYNMRYDNRYRLPLFPPLLDALTLIAIGGCHDSCPNIAQEALDIFAANRAA
jgi:hypothetical protein